MPAASTEQGQYWHKINTDLKKKKKERIGGEQRMHRDWEDYFAISEGPEIASKGSETSQNHIGPLQCSENAEADWVIWQTPSAAEKIHKAMIWSEADGTLGVLQGKPVGSIYIRLLFMKETLLFSL